MERKGRSAEQTPTMAVVVMDMAAAGRQSAASAPVSCVQPDSVAARAGLMAGRSANPQSRTAPLFDATSSSSCFPASRDVPHGVACGEWSLRGLVSAFTGSWRSEWPSHSLTSFTLRQLPAERPPPLPWLTARLPPTHMHLQRVRMSCVRHRSFVLSSPPPLPRAPLVQVAPAHLVTPATTEPSHPCSLRAALNPYLHSCISHPATATDEVGVVEQVGSGDAIAHTTHTNSATVTPAAEPLYRLGYQEPPRSCAHPLQGAATSITHRQSATASSISTPPAHSSVPSTSLFAHPRQSTPTLCKCHPLWSPSPWLTQLSHPLLHLRHLIHVSVSSDCWARVLRSCVSRQALPAFEDRLCLRPVPRLLLSAALRCQAATQVRQPVPVLCVHAVQLTRCASEYCLVPRAARSRH